MKSFVPFKKNIYQLGLNLDRRAVSTVQINLGKLCNQACHHCHVDAGPNRKEIMSETLVERLIDLIAQSPSVQIIDITGGAPEMNPYFRKLVTAVRKLDKEVMDRCNLTVLFEAGQEDTANFLKDHQVQIVSSLPCYSAQNVDRQRGSGVFDKSIRALNKLNALGYGKDGSGLILNLVYNPLGPFLPPEQSGLEKKYKEELFDHFGIEFHQLFTITNMPIHRFLRDLKRQGQDQEYMELLLNNFNPGAAQGVMCRDLVSISWDGFVYDCDFNQMLEIPLNFKKRSVWDIETFEDLSLESIAFENHCYGCTAGSGSSCSGSLT